MAIRILLTLFSFVVFFPPTAFAFNPVDLSHLEDYDTRMYAHIETLGVDLEASSCNLGSYDESRSTSFLITSTSASGNIPVRVMSGRCTGKYGLIRRASVLNGDSAKLQSDYRVGLDVTIAKLEFKKDTDGLKLLSQYLQGAREKQQVNTAIEKIGNQYASDYKSAELENSIEKYEWFIKKYPSAPQIDKAINASYLLIEKENKISGYKYFIKTFPDAPQVEKALAQCYMLIEKENNIAAYQWFIDNFPVSLESRNALKNIHKLAFKQAQDIDTVSAYNDFIVVYPLSSQREDAEKRAYQIEKKEYSRFFTSDEKLARALSIKAMQMKRKASENNNNAYLLIVVRMTRMLEEMFPYEHSTERHLENDEILNALKKVSSQLEEIKEINTQIADNTSNLSSILRKQSEMMNSHYLKAAEDRKMAEKYTKDHRYWERYLKQQGIS